MKSILVKDHFYSQASSLRRHFEKSFENPLQTHESRFVWDYWNVPDQYRLIRTPAYNYFDESSYKKFHTHLVNWGRENLGCHDISPSWLSYYVEGCRQELHADVPHGPWAFVYSLSPQVQKFSGGETLILKDRVLNYWTQFATGESLERKSFIEKIPPSFNRLIVFDPRVPHGVSEVEGVTDPLEARLVIHGWFVQPRPYVVGGLTVAAVEKVLTAALQESEGDFQQMGSLHGTMSFRLFVGANGQVTESKILTNTVQGLESPYMQKRNFISWAKNFPGTLRFPKAKKTSAITLPLIFE